MEMVQIPLSAIQSSIDYFTDVAEEYKDMPDMKMWAEGRLSAYKAILEIWHTA